MTGVEVWALAIGLSMDCLAVAVASGVIMERVRWRPMLTMALAFGLFQALNPLIGWLGTNYFRHLIESVDHWIAFAILLFLGGRMVIESFGKEENKHFNPLDTKVILTMALATSIDALAVGISFVCMGMNEASDLVYPLCVIGFVSFAVTMAGLLFGIKFGGRYARRIKADLWGGIILIAIGVRVLVERLQQCCYVGRTKYDVVAIADDKGFVPGDIVLGADDGRAVAIRQGWVLSNDADLR